MREQGDRVASIAAELDRRPKLVSNMRVREHDDGSDPRPPRDGWAPVLPVLPNLKGLDPGELRHLETEMVRAMEWLARGEIGEGLTDEQREIERQIGKLEIDRLQAWSVSPQEAERVERRWLDRRIGQIGVKFGLRTFVNAMGDTRPLTPEEREERDMLLAKLRRRPDPAAASVAAAVAAYLCGDHVERILLGGPRVKGEPELSPFEAGLLLTLLGMLAKLGDGPHDWRQVKEQFRWRIHLETSPVEEVNRLGQLGYLRIERSRTGKAGSFVFSYGERTLQIARAAGVKIPEPAGAAA